MVLSDLSLAISSAFSSDLISTTPFQFVKAPKQRQDPEEMKVGRSICLFPSLLYVFQLSKQQEQQDEINQAFGEYAGNTQGQELVMRVKKNSAYGGYKVVKLNVGGGGSSSSNGGGGRVMSRSELLDLRCKGRSDKHCS